MLPPGWRYENVEEIDYDPVLWRMDHLLSNLWGRNHQCWVCHRPEVQVVYRPEIVLFAYKMGIRMGMHVGGMVSLQCRRDPEVAPYWMMRWSWLGLIRLYLIRQFR